MLGGERKGFVPRGEASREYHLDELMTQEQTPIFVYENEDGQILGHLFVINFSNSYSLYLPPLPLKISGRAWW